MNKRLQDVLFTEILNRYNRYFISLIRLKFQEAEEVKAHAAAWQGIGHT